MIIVAVGVKLFRRLMLVIVVKMMIIVRSEI